MKRKGVIFLLAFSSFCSFAQKKKSYKNEIDNLKRIESMPYFPELSGDSLFWNITKKRIAIVPELIERIDDTTLANAFVPNFGGRYTIGDICVRAIEEIIRDIPTIALIEKDKNKISEKAYGIYWEYVRESLKNRKLFKKKMKQWFEANKSKLVWVKDDKLYATSDNENDVKRKLPAGGYYKIKVNGKKNEKIE